MTLPILSADDPRAVAAVDQPSTPATSTSPPPDPSPAAQNSPPHARPAAPPCRTLLHVATDGPAITPTARPPSPRCRGGRGRQRPVHRTAHRDPAALGGQQRRRGRPRRAPRRRRGARGRSRAGIQCGPLPRPGQCGVVRRRRRPGPSGEDPRRRGRCRGGAAGARGVGGPQGDDPGDPQHHHDRPAQLGTPQHGADRVGSRRRARVGEPDCGASCAAVTAAISAAISPGR